MTVAGAGSTVVTDEDLLPNRHPGEILALEFMQPVGLSQNALARALHVPPRRINELVHGKRAVSADSDLRLAAISASRKAVSSACRPTTT